MGTTDTKEDPRATYVRVDRIPGSIDALGALGGSAVPRFLCDLCVAVNEVPGLPRRTQKRREISVSWRECAQLLVKRDQRQPQRARQEEVACVIRGHRLP